MENRRRPKTKAEFVEEALEGVQELLRDSKAKATVGDFIRLLQLQQDLKAEEVKEIVVTWLDPEEKPSVTAE